LLHCLRKDASRSELYWPDPRWPSSVSQGTSPVICAILCQAPHYSPSGLMESFAPDRAAGAAAVHVVVIHLALPITLPTGSALAVVGFHLVLSGHP